MTFPLFNSPKRSIPADQDRQIANLYFAALHFKLVIPKTTTGPYEKAIYQYIPLLDANRDRELVDILPDFLMDHITFERQAVTKFYTRVIDALTKRRASSS